MALPAEKRDVHHPRRGQRIGVGPDAVGAVAVGAARRQGVAPGGSLTVQRPLVLLRLLTVADRAVRWRWIIRVWEVHALVAHHTEHASRTVDRSAEHPLGDVQPRAVAGACEHLAVPVTHQARLVVLCGGRNGSASQDRGQNGKSGQECCAHVHVAPAPVRGSTPLLPARPPSPVPTCGGI